MSADREPTAVEVIAEALFGTYGQEDHHRSRSIALHALAALKAAGFVVATRDEIRAMTPQEQAELVGGEVQRHAGSLADPEGSLFDLVVGPWREVQP